MLAATRRPLRLMVSRGMIFAYALLGLWELAKRTGVLATEMLPPPSQCLAALVRLAADGPLLQELRHTVSATLIGWAVTSVVAVVLGVAIGSFRRADFFSSTSIEILRAVPAISLLPPAILVFGFSMRMELVLIMFAAHWPILVNTIGGVRTVTTQQLETGRTLRLGPWRTQLKIVLPGAMPMIGVGLRVSLGLALVLAVAAEMVGNPAGLGHGLVFSQEALRPDEMLAYFFCIGFLGLALNLLLTRALRLTHATSGRTP